MLRVSDFCRGPLSPVKSSSRRRRRRPSFDHSDDNKEAASDTYTNSLEDDFDLLYPVEKGLQCEEEEEEEEETSCVVRLSIWNRPLSSLQESSACAKVPLDVLKGISLQNGDCAVLEKYFLGDRVETGTSDFKTLLQKMVVRLQLMDEDEEQEHADDACLVPPIVLANLGTPPQTMWQQNSDGSDTLIEHGVVFRLRALHEKYSDGIISNDGWQIDNGMSTVPAKGKVASHVLLRPLGRAPLWPWFSLTPPSTFRRENNQRQQSQDVGKNEEDHSNNFEDNASIHRHPNSNHAKDDFWIYPSRSGIILQESTLCEVRYNSKNHDAKQNVCYYEVLRLYTDEDHDADKGEEKERKNDDSFYVTAPSTQFELDSHPLSAFSYIRRLPLPSPFSSPVSVAPASSNTTSTLEKKSNQKRRTRSLGDKVNDTMITPRNLFEPSEISSPYGGAFQDDIDLWCHPDWKKVARALLDAPTMGFDGSDVHINNIINDSRILHLIGTDTDHDLQVCVTNAASMVGMQCLSIKGLAAFGYEHRRSKNSNGESTGVTARSPMIEQQLAGIDAALEYIVTRRMEPCVLHLVAVDEEIAFAANDDQLRSQIEDRFWSKWTEVVSKKRINEDASHHRALKDENDKNYGLEGGMVADRLDYCYTPRILIVISTKSPLKQGPWLERLIFPSITLSLPDELYIGFLWNKSVTTKSCDDEVSTAEKNEESYLTLTEEMIRFLRGRPAQEIVQLRQRMLFEINADGKNMNDDCAIDTTITRDAKVHHLERICKDFDEGRRKASSDVARISNISWKDVGGLDHVRAEILDAIELPLKHPHLFPPNTGRSGILLFGPPGTGKTLVAKAVATECGLPFLSVKGPELLGSYVGESEANIRKVFSSARLAAENNLPIQASILFFDELDSLAPKRGGNNNHGGGVMERVVASLLAELDGGSKKDCGRVFVLGATNRPDLLDPSLLRPGRLDRLVYLGIPIDDKERTRVLASQLRKMKVEGDAFQMAKSVIEEGLPPRLSGADMSKLSSGAMLHAIRRLCSEADKEREKILRKQQGQGGKVRNVTIDEILESWGEEKCTPVITLDDLRLASKDVSPSVSVVEMQRYEHLRAEHETSSNREKRKQ